MLQPTPITGQLSAGANTLSLGTAVFSNSNNVSFGINGQTITASVSGAGGAFSAGVSTGGNTGGNTGVSGTRLVLVGSQNITLNQATDANGLTVSFSGGAGAAGNTGFISANATASLGTVVFSNSNGVSFGINGQTLTGSINSTSGAGTGFTTTAQLGTAVVGTHDSAGLKLGVPAFITTWTVPTVTNSSLTMQAGGSTLSSVSRIAFVDSNGVSFGASTSNNGSITITGTVKTDYLTAAVGLNTAQTNVTWTVNSSGISINAGGYAGTGFTTTATAGTVVVGTNNTAGLKLGVPAFITTWTVPTVTNSSLTMQAGGSTLSSVSRIAFVDSNGVSFGASTSNNGSISITATVATSYLASNASTNYVQANAVFNGTNASGTIASNAISISVAAPGGGGTGGFYFSGNTTISTTGTMDLRSVSIAGAGAVTVGFDTAASQIVISGGTAAAGSLSFYGLSNTTGTSSGTGAGSISMAGAGAISVAASNSGFIVSSPVTSSLSATGWASLSTNGSTISIGASFTQNVYAAGNTFTSSSGTCDPRSITFSGAGNLSVQANNTGWVVSVPYNYNSFFEPVQWQNVNTGTSTGGLGTLCLQPFTLANFLTFNALNLIGSAVLSGTFGGTANTFSVSIGGASSFGFSATAAITNSNIIQYALFTRGSGSYSDMLFTLSTSSAYIATAFNNVVNLSATGGAATFSASAFSSMSVSVTWPGMTSGQAVNGASSWTTWAPGYTSSNSSTTASAGWSTSTGATSSSSIGSAFPGNLSSFFQSNKIIPLPFAGSLTPGEYWLGVWRTNSTASGLTTANANVGANHSYTSSINWSAGTSTNQVTWAGSTQTLASSLGFLGFASQATMIPSPGQGSFSATYATNTTYANAAGQPVGAIALSNINSNVSMFRSWMQMALNRI